MFYPREALERALRNFKRYSENQHGCIDAMRRDIPNAIEAMIEQKVNEELEKRGEAILRALEGKDGQKL